MRYIIAYTLISFFVLAADAQRTPSKPKDTSYIVKYDTINLRGIVYGFDGKPATGLRIGFFPGKFHPQGFATVTKTDKRGKFELKGASTDDRVAIWDGRYSNLFYPINGSRYIAIYLPPARIGHAIYDTVGITAVRKNPKVIPSFTIHDDGSRIFPEYDRAPNPEIGQVRFRELFKNDISYPLKAVSNNIEGTVEIGFNLDKTGTPFDFITLKGIGYGCEEEVINLIKRAGKWRLGIISGEPYSILQTVTVQFKLTDK